MEAATKEVMLLGIYFMILFTAFNSFQTIVTKINEDEGDYTVGSSALLLTTLSS